MKYLAFLFLLLSCLAACTTTKPEVGPPLYPPQRIGRNSNGEVTLQGTITEWPTGDAVLFGAVALYQNGKLLVGTETDFDGHYIFHLPNTLDTAYYALEASYLGLITQRIEDVSLPPCAVVQADISMQVDRSFKRSSGCGGYSYKIPLVEQDNTTSGRTFTSEEIKHSAARGN